MRRIAGVLALLVLASLAAQPGQAQKTQKPDAAAQALEELRCLRVFGTLQITKDQAASIIEALGEVDKQRQTYVKWAADTWKSQGSQLKAVAQAWAAGAQVDQQQVAATMQVFETWRQMQGALQEAAEKGAIAVLQQTKAGPDLAEGPRRAEARRAAERQLHGARSVPEFILMAAESLRLLMPDDYHLVRFAEAQRLADAIADSPQGPPTELLHTVLVALDNLTSLPPRAFVDQRHQILLDLAQRFGVNPVAVAEPLVTWDELVECVKSPQALVALSEIAGKTPPAVTLSPQELERVMAQARLAALTLDLQLTGEQLSAFSQIMGRVTVLVARRDKVTKTHGDAALALLPAVRQSITSGQPLDLKAADSFKKLFDDLTAADLDLKLAMMPHLVQLRRLLAPPQRAMVDWVPPGEVLRQVSPATRADELKRRAAMIADALGFINSVKYSVANEYRNRKVQFSLDFLSQYFRPDTPAFDHALDFTLRLLTDARHVDLQDWENGVGVEYATNLLRGLGIIRDRRTPLATGQELYTWRDVYEVMTGAAHSAVADRKKTKGGA
ncbi:MAG: hypothetical protein J7M26_08930 [Armatimonadetes bacterium]|nr:hypothetical protein [Armatimonadota bacterium]